MFRRIYLGAYLNVVANNIEDRDVYLRPKVSGGKKRLAI